MPTLYSAQVPAGYNTASTGKISWEQAATNAKSSTKLGAAGLPYLVSGPLSDKFWGIGIVGAVIHVLFWIFSLVIDALLVSRGDSGAVWHAASGFTFALACLIFTILGLLVLLVIVITHWATQGIADGAIPPFLTTLVTGSVKITVALTLALVVNLVPGAGYAAGADMDADHAWHEQRWLLMLSLIAKVFLTEILANNIFWGGSYTTNNSVRY